MPSYYVQAANIASAYQRRWAALAVPYEIAKELPKVIQIGHWVGMRGRDVGVHSTIYHVLADMGPGQGFLEVRGLEGPAADQLAQAILEAPRGPHNLLPAGALHVGGEVQPLGFLGAHDEGPARIVRVGADVRGFHARLWATLYPWQNVIDVRGVVFWSDPSTSAWYKNAADVRMEFHGEFTSHTGRTWANAGERVHACFPGPDDRVGDGMGIALRGLWRPDLEDESRDEEVTDAFGVAKEGPILLEFCHWNEQLFGFRELPRHPHVTIPPARESEQVYQAWVAGWPASKTWEAPYLLANKRNAGDPGDQVVFGATKGGLELRSCDPRLLWRLLVDGADDYASRTIWQMDANGMFLTRDAYPDWRTWSCATHHVAGFRNGKASAQPWGWNVRPGPDDQHRGGAYAWLALALTGDPLLDLMLRRFVAVDEARAKRRTPDAPRAGGRLLQDWAKMVLLADASTAARIVQLADEEMEMRASMFYGDPHTVRPQQIVRDRRVLNLEEPDSQTLVQAWMPWHESLLILGLWEFGCAKERLGLDPGAYFKLALALAEQNLLHAVVEGADGHLYPVNGALYNGGEPVPPVADGLDYLSYPRHGVTFNGGEWGKDLLLGTPGWWWWHAAAPLAYLKLQADWTPDPSQADKLLSRALEISERYLQPANWRESEWIAVES